MREERHHPVHLSPAPVRRIRSGRRYVAPSALRGTGTARALRCRYARRASSPCSPVARACAANPKRSEIRRAVGPARHRTRARVSMPVCEKGVITLFTCRLRPVWRIRSGRRYAAPSALRGIGPERALRCRYCERGAITLFTCRLRPVWRIRTGRRYAAPPVPRGIGTARAPRRRHVKAAPCAVRWDGAWKRR